jgi:tetratricopeptide (TPR) repeat protein
VTTAIMDTSPAAWKPQPPQGLPARPVPSDRELPPMRSSIPSYSAEDDTYGVPRRRRVGGWVVALVLLLAAGVGGWGIARPYLLARQAAATVHLDPRALQFVVDGERAMGSGDLDSAQEAFDKASALAERDPRVLVDKARVSAARADIAWLKLRLLPADAADESRATRLQLDEAVARARRAADEALAVAPQDDPAALRARIDALRLAGDKDAARASVSRVVTLASQPETAYVLAALDLAEPDPLWTTVIDRLRTAAAGEGGAGRAHAALVYALARSGDTSGARGELAKMDSAAHPYPLLPALRAFVDKAPSRPAAGPAASAPRGDVSTSALPSQRPAGPAEAPAAGAAPPAAVARSKEGSGEEGSGGPTTGGMQAASQAIKRGDWGRARQIYEALVARDPSDSEALSGIGDVDRAQGNMAGAIGAYKRALAVNPSYMPALLGVADTQWASGNRAEATRAYKDIADRFPEGTYPAYVKARAEEGAASGGAKGASTGEREGL